MYRAFLLVMLMSLLNTSATAAPTTIPTGGEVVIDSDLAKAALVGAGTAGGAANKQDVTVDDQPFTRAVRVEISKPVGNPWDVQLRFRTTKPIAKGDVLLCSFALRGVVTRGETNEVSAGVVFEQNAAPYAKSLETTATATAQWRTLYFRFVAAEDYPAGKAALGLQVGQGLQTLEIAQLTLINYAGTRKIEDLPITRPTYIGRDASAKWRKDAAERIEKIRKGDLTVIVLDAAGRPVEGAQVAVRMQRHAFAFGSCVAAQAILDNSPDGEKYRQAIKELFNRVVMENDLKWPQWEANRKRATSGVKWLTDNGIEVRGHNLIWPSWKNAPKDLKDLAADPAALRKRISDHITEEAAAMHGQLVDWDVINEPFSEKDVMKVLGNEEMIQWFKLARAADPKARLFLNDYPILSPSPGAHIDHFEKTIRFLIDGGAPLDGIGVQCHYGDTPPAPAQLLAGLDRFAKFKLPISVTEFDVNTTDEQLQADYYRDHTIAMFSHPAVDSILMWGFWEGRHWRPNAALYRKDWSIKPAGKAWKALVLGEWWTNADVRSGADGLAAVRGFLGDYQITATKDGKQTSANAKLIRQGTKVELRFEP